MHVRNVAKMKTQARPAYLKTEKAARALMSHVEALLKGGKKKKQRAMFALRSLTEQQNLGSCPYT